jgi:hypothetical protein
MKEQVRVFLNGQMAEFRRDWEERLEWPFGTMGFAVLDSQSKELQILREILPNHPSVRCGETVDRSYSKSELLQFDGFVWWKNCDLELPTESGLEFSDPCAVCSFAQRRRRTRPIDIPRRKVPKKDIAVTDHWEIVLSPKVAQSWRGLNLIGATLMPVTIDGKLSDFVQLDIQSSLEGPEILETVHCEGEECPGCGRFKKVHPRHPSKELWIPRSAWLTQDVCELAPSLERSHHHRVLISGRVYQMLLAVKATGFWVQPIHST